MENRVLIIETINKNIQMKYKLRLLLKFLLLLISLINNDKKLNIANIKVHTDSIRENHAGRWGLRGGTLYIG